TLRCCRLAMQLFVKCFQGCSQHLSLPFTAHFTPTECCFKFARRAVRHVESFYETPKECSLAAVVIVTANGTKVCASPTTPWVKKAMETVQKKK
ncbi:CCL4 protein, partial [Crotophaga sulcirostris]|nr:CCL4 protein [Crotophaga sulcirostris]